MGSELARGWRLARIEARAALPRLIRAVAPAWVLLLLAVVQADAIVDWGAVHAGAMARAPVERAALAALLALGWAAHTAPALRAATRTEADRWRWRVPVGDAGLAVGLAPVWVAAAMPLALAGLLLDLPLALPAAAVHPTLALASGRRAEALAGAALAAPLLWAAAWVPVGPVLVALGAWRGAHALHAAPPPSAAAVRSGWRPRTVASAVWWRDLLALWRLERGLPLAALLVSGPAWAVQSTAVHNYPLAGESAVRAGLLVLTLAGTAAAAGVLALPTLLGEALDLRRAPLSAAGRAALLAAVGGTLALPTCAAVLLGGSGGAGRVLVHGAALVCGAAWFAVGLTRRTDADRTSFLWWVIGLGLLAFAPSPHQPLAATALAALALAGATHSLAWARRRP